MYPIWTSLLVIFLWSSLCHAEDGFTMDVRSAPLLEHLQNSNSNFARSDNIPTPDKATFNIYPTLVKNVGPDNGEYMPLCDGNNERSGTQCRTILRNPDTEARTSSGLRIGSDAVLRQPNQHQVYPPSINYGNAVHIEGNFQGQSRPSSARPQRNVSNANGQPPNQQSPLLSFNMHSEPHFYPNIPTTFYPSAPSDSHQSQPQESTEGTIFRINSKLLANNSDFSTLLQTLRQQNQNHHSEKVPNGNINSHGQQNSEHANVFPPSLPAQIVVDSLTPTKNTQATTSDTSRPGTLPSTTTRAPILPWTNPDSPLTESQSLAILRGQISALQKQHLSNLQPTPAAAAVIPTSNTINIQVPNGSAVSAHQHQSDIADILTNLQILTILMNQDNKTKAVINGVAQTEYPSHSNGKEEKSTNGNIQQQRHFSHNMGVHPFNNPHAHARTKSQAISSMPFYTNQFAITPNQLSNSKLEYSLAEKQIAHMIRSRDSSHFDAQNGDRRQTDKGIANSNARINSAGILNAWPGSQDQNDYSKLLSQLLLKQMLSESKETLVTEQYVNLPTSTKPQTAKPDDGSDFQVTPGNNLEIQNNTKLANIRKPSPNTIAPETTLPQSVIPAVTSPSQNSQSNSLLTTIASPLAITELGNGNTVDHPLQDTPSPPSQLTLQELQQLEIYHNLLNKFNNRYQHQPENGIPIPVNVPTTPSSQDLILASILQTQVLKKPDPTPPFLGPNDPYVPAIHGDSISSLHSIFAQPPAPPPTINVPVRNTLMPTRIPFPVRAAGGAGGGSSYTSIQECLKNTACALLLAGIVATGTTAALAIPVLTPLFGAGFLGKRRRRGLDYFVIKPEETVDFIDNYFRYLNGTNTAELSEEAKCIYDVIKNPNAESSMTILHSLFEYIFENKNKTLNISVDEIRTIKEPLVNSSSKFSKNDENNSSTLNNGNSHASSHSDLPNSDQTLNETIPHYENPDNHSDTTESIQEFDISSLPLLVKHSTEINPSSISNVNSEHQQDTISNDNQRTQHFSNSDWLRNRYTPQRFRPIPSPNVLLHASQIHPNMGYLHNSGAPLHTMSSLEAKLSSYLSSAKDQTEKHHLFHPITTLPQYISSSTQPPILQNLFNLRGLLQTDAQYSQVDHQPRNKFGLSPDSFDQSNPSNVNSAQLSLGIINFYHNVCHALGEPGIPQSSVITFIAQRCLSFAHAGLIQ